MPEYLCLFVLLLASGPIPGQVSAPAPKPVDSKPDYSKEAFVDEEGLASIVFDNDGTSTRETSTRVRIQSDAGVQRFGVLTYPYQSATESVEIVYVRVKKPDGTVINTPAENVQDMPSDITRQAPFYSDLHEKHVAVKGLGVGDVLESQIRWRVTKPLAPGQFWFAYNFSRDFIVQHEELRISIPRERAVKWKSSDVQPVIKDENGRRIFTWTHSQLQHESDDETKKEQEERIYQASRGKLPPPEVLISSFQTWEEIGAWYNGLQAERVKPSPEIQAKAAELTKDAKDDDAKLHAIYNYVSTQFRYIGVAFGIGRYQPHSAAEVLANQYGDCKDKHTLLASLLEAAGFKAYPALISASHDMDLDVPSPAQFDHVITAVPQGNGFTWLDTTAEVARFADLVSPLQSKRALVVPPDKPATVATTPAEGPSPGLQNFKIDAELSDSGTLEGKVERTIRGGDLEIVLRAAFRSVPLPQWKDLIQRLSYSSGFAGDVSEVTASPPEKTEDPFHFAYTYTRKDYPDWSEHRISSPLPPLLTQAPDSKPSHPILLGSLQELHYESRVHLPAGYSPALPSNSDLKEDFAEYHARYSVEKGVLVTDRRLLVKLREVPTAEFEAYKKFAKAVSDDHEVYVALSTGLSDLDAYQAAIWNLPDSDNPDAMKAYKAAETEINGDVPATIESLKRAVELDRKFVRAWLWMGQLYVFRRQRDLATEIFRKAIEADPHQAISYKLAGSNLMSLQKYEEAAGVWRSLIVTEPQDVDGPSGLGSALMALKQYAEAAQAYESAVSLNPDRAFLQEQLGGAYLRAGNEDKAMAAFKRTLELDSQPLWFNNISYMLAEADKQLPVALEYAERAVREEEEASAKVNLPDLKKEDLGYTSSLGAYWDTLGWVYFRLGDYSKAEKYLNAAWMIIQSPTPADHLGQTYEKQGQKANAVRMYRLALASSRSPDRLKDIQARLDKLGGGTKTGRFGQNGIEELNQMRTFKLEPIEKHTASAEFFMLLSRGPRVEDVKFVSGSETLRTADKLLRSLPIAAPFPDDGPARLVRRGVLSCYPSTGCSFVLYIPSDVRSVD